MLGVTLVLKNSQCRCMAQKRIVLKTRSPSSGLKRFRHLQIIERFQSSKVPASLEDGGPVSATETKLEDIPLSNIRNFSIIAHVDHGKSTLADRMLEITGALATTPQNKQVLDRLQVERERGITVKAQTASLRYSLCGQEFLLNLIDTPGHIDFSNEVSRSLAACQGVILLVDANQGVQAQTVANFYLAFTQELVIIPVLNKVDLKNANPDAVAQQLKDLFGIEPQETLKISAKFGTGVADVLKAIVERVPPPPSNRDAPLRALLFDSWYDRYRGAVGLLYIVDGSLMVGDEVTWFHSPQNYTVKSLGTLHPHEHPSEALRGGQVGYMTCSMRSTKEAVIGDTLVHKGSLAEALPSLQSTRPMVYAGIYPFDQSEHINLRSALERLTLNDYAVSITTDSSPALGHGWRLGFLGLLHMEVFNQRLEQEHNVQAIITAPSVTYKVKITGDKNIKLLGGSELFISDPSHFPDPNIITEIQEPIVLGTIITPVEYMGDVLSLCMERRGVQKSSRNIDNSRLMLQFLLPLNEILVDFHDSLKSISSGFASFDYEDQGYQESSLVKMNFLLNGIAIDELSVIVHSRKASLTGRRMCRKLLDIIPRQQFQVAIQAKVGGKVLARENLKPFRKDVTAKLYGGDVTRKNKLLKRQAEGKARLKSIANISLPRQTFIEVLKQ